MVDPEARRGKPGAYVDGDLLAISLEADRELLGAVQVLAGNGDEARDAQTLLAAEEQAQGHDIAALSMDGIGWPGEVLRTLSASTGLGVEVYVPPRAEPTEGMSCRPEPFSLDAATGVLRCPGGHQTTSKERNTNDTGWKFTCARRTCAHCALPAQCLAVLPQHQGRSVIKHDYQPEYAAARQRATTEAYPAVRRNIRGSSASWPISCATMRPSHPLPWPVVGAGAIFADRDGGRYQAYGEVAEPSRGAVRPAARVRPLGKARRGHLGPSAAHCTDPLALSEASGAVALTRLSISPASWRFNLARSKQLFKHPPFDKILLAKSWGRRAFIHTHRLRPQRRKDASAPAGSPPTRQPRAPDASPSP